MKGLIIKDFLYLKNMTRSIIVIFIGSLILSFSLNNYMIFISIIPLMLITCGINTHQADEFFKTESFTITYPISRSEIVLSKYIFTLLLFVLALVLGSILYLISFIINSSAVGVDILYMLFIILLIGLIIDFIFYPIIYKYGCEKSSFVITSIILIGASILSLINLIFPININISSLITFFENYGLFILFITTILLFIISLFLSIKIYEHQDL